MSYIRNVGHALACPRVSGSMDSAAGASGVLKAESLRPRRAVPLTRSADSLSRRNNFRREKSVRDSLSLGDAAIAVGESPDSRSGAGMRSSEQRLTHKDVPKLTAAQVLPSQLSK